MNLRTITITACFTLLGLILIYMFTKPVYAGGLPPFPDYVSNCRKATASDIPAYNCQDQFGQFIQCQFRKLVFTERWVCL